MTILHSRVAGATRQTEVLERIEGGPDVQRDNHGLVAEPFVAIIVYASNPSGDVACV